MQLTKGEDLYWYSDLEVEVNFDLIDFQVVTVNKLNYTGNDIVLDKAAEMKVIIDSVSF